MSKIATRNRTVVPASSAPLVAAVAMASSASTGDAPPEPDVSQAPAAAAKLADNRGAEVASAGEGSLEPAIAPPLVEGRILRAFEHYLPNDVDSWPADDAEVLENGGFIDTHAKAVAYAKSLKEG